MRVLPALVGRPAECLYALATRCGQGHPGAENIGTYNKTPVSSRKWCKTCGGHLFTEHPPLNLTDVYAAMLPQLKFQPALHVNYQETVLRIKDGLPKMKDFPKEFGGSGESLPE